MEIRFLLLSGFVIGLVIACSPAQKNKISTISTYQPVSRELYDSIVRMDSIFFDAYNNCRLDIMAAYIADDIEFYHDNGGLSTSKKDILEALKNNICDKVTRELIKGSVEVYPIQGYGAVQIGLHRFYNKLDAPGSPSKPGKFIHTWKKENNKWQIRTIISLHNVAEK